MSYSIRIRAEHGAAVVVETTGTVPDGMFTLNGHADGSAQSFGATHADLDGRHSLTISGNEYTAPQPATAPAAEQTTLT